MVRPPVYFMIRVYDKHGKLIDSKLIDGEYIKTIEIDIREKTKND